MNDAWSLQHMAWNHTGRLTLKPMYSLGENTNFSNGFVYRALWILKALWIVLSKTINILRKLQQQQKNIFGKPPRIVPYVMYTAPSSGHPLLNFKGEVQ